jgi:predicted phosphodiesterase
MTTHLVISDIHEDIKSLQSLIEKYQGQFHDIWFLGDIFGHGEHLNGSASPIECYQILYEYELNNRLVCVKGNWEKWISWPPAPLTKIQSKWHSKIMDAHQIIDSQGLMNWITNWDSMIKKDEFTLTHGWIEQLDDQRESDLWETYLEYWHLPQVTHAFLFDRITTRHAIVGHTHDPGFFLFNGRTTGWFSLDQKMIDRKQAYGDQDLRFILNPGSLSGARDPKHNGLRTALLINTEEKSFRFISI